MIFRLLRGFWVDLSETEVAFSMPRKEGEFDPRELWYQFLDQVEALRCLREEASDFTGVDQFWEANEFRWLHEKQVSLEVVDREAELERYREFMQLLVRKAKSSHVCGNETLMNMVNEAFDYILSCYKEEAESLDRQLAADTRTTEQELFNDYRELDNKLLNFLNHYAEKLPIKTLEKFRKRIHVLRDKHEISYNTYVKAMNLVLEAGNLICRWEVKRLETFRRLLWDLQQFAGERTDVGQCALSEDALIAAIDTRAKARRLTNFRGTLKEACMMLHNKEVNEQTFLVEMPEEDVSDYDDIVAWNNEQQEEV